MPSYTAEERKALARAVAAGRGLECPACGGVVSRQEVPKPREVAYVRRRVWLLCTACMRTGAVDLPQE
jgi:hypothetical protein